MVKLFQLPDKTYLEFPDEMPQEQVEALAFDFAKTNNIFDPSMGSLFGGATDGIQKALSNIPIAGLEKVEELTDTDLTDWKQIFEDVRAENKEASEESTKTALAPQEMGKDPIKFVKQQVAIQAPQMIGILAANAIPGLGKVVGKAAMGAYFTGLNLDRQREEGQEYNLMKAMTYATGQTASESLFMKALGALPGGGFIKQMGKVAATGIGGEVFQQGLERASASLDLTNEEAANEYIDSAIGAAVFVGAGAPLSYMTTRGGEKINLSDKIKQKAENGEKIVPEELIEEQIRDMSSPFNLVDVVETDDGVSITPEQLPLLVDQSNKILEGAGLSPDYFTTPEDKAKAASVVLRNSHEHLTMDQKVDDLTEAGLDPKKVREYETLNPREFLNDSTVDTLAAIEGIDVEAATQRLQPVIDKQLEVQNYANNIASNFDTDVDIVQQDPSLNQITESLKQLAAEQELLNPIIEKLPKRYDAGDLDMEVPSWLKKKEAEGVRRVLDVKQRDVKSRLAENVKEKGYYEFIPDDGKDTTDILVNEAIAGKNPRKTAKANDTLTKPDINKTINSFAQNEQGLLNYKRERDQVKRQPEVDPRQAELTPRSQDMSILEKVQPLADKVNIEPQTVTFMDRVFKTVTKATTTRAKGINLGKVLDKINTDPIYKVQLANYVDTSMSSDMNTTQGLELFYFLFDHSPALNATDKKVLQSKFKETYTKTAPLFGQDTNVELGPEAKKEYLANLYDQAFHEGNKDFINKAPREVRDILKKMKMFDTRVKAEMRRQKVTRPGQLIENVEALREERLRGMVDEQAARDAFDNLVNSEKNKDEAKLLDEISTEVLNGPSRYNKVVGNFVAWTSSLHSLASRSPLAATVLSVVESRDFLRTDREYRTRQFIHQLQEIENVTPPGFINDISERIHRLEEVEGSYDLSQPGIVTIIDAKGKPVSRLRNENAYNAFSIIDNMKKTILESEAASIRTHLPYLGIKNKNISIKGIDNVVSLVEGQISIDKTSLDSDVRANARVAEERLTKLKNIAKELRDIDNVSSKAWFPRVRNGSLGLTVYRKGMEGKPGGQVYFGTFNEQKGSLDRKPDKEEFKDVVDYIKANYGNSDEFVVYGFDGKKYNPATLDVNSVNPINLTRNADIQRHNINSLVSAFDLLEDMGGLTSDTERVKRLKDTFEMKAQGNFTYFGDRRFIDGYEKDALKALETFARRQANHVTTREFTPQLRMIEKQLDKYSGPSAGVNQNAVISAVRNHLEFNLNPQESLAWAKSFNYMIAMGGSIKSALVQLTQLFTLTQAYANTFNGSPLRNARMTSVALAEASKFLEFSKGFPGLSIDNPNQVKAILDKVNPKFMTDDQKKLFGKLIPTRHFESIQQKVYLEGAEALAKKFDRKSALGKAGHLINKPVSALNSLVGMTESYGRLANTFLFLEMFNSNPRALAKFEAMMQNEPKFQKYSEMYSKMGADRASIGALYMLDETFLVTGSSGKSKIARSGAMNLVAPFTNFAGQLIGALNRLYGRDKFAFAQMALYSVMLGGMGGIPFFSNLKELVELIFRGITGGNMDLELAIREKIYQMTGSPSLSLIATKGVPARMGMDLSGSVQQELPLFNHALKIFDPNTKLSEAISIPSSFITGTLEAAFSVAEGTGDLISGKPVDPDIASFIEKAVPYKAVKDAAKAYKAATGPITTKRGKALLPSQEDDWGYLALQAAGFVPTKLSEARDNNWMEGIKNQSNSMVNVRAERNDLWIRYYNTDNEQKKARIKQEIHQNVKKAYKTAREEGINFNTLTYYKDGRKKGLEIVHGIKDPKRIRKGVRKEVSETSKMFMLE